jgi:hypothetical protein
VKIVRIINKGIMRWKKCRRKGEIRELTVLLDKDSFERFNRLKTQIPASDNAGIIASALKCLDQKTDRIIKRQVMKIIQAMNNEGYDPQQTSDYLNEKGFPAVAETDKWNSDIISKLLNKENRNLIEREKEIQHKSH